MTEVVRPDIPLRHLNDVADGLEHHGDTRTRAVRSMLRAQLSQADVVSQGWLA
jgi:hypothetical protein